MISKKGEPGVLFFESPQRLREWFEAHHEKEKELWVGFHKRDSGRPSITWPQCVEESLCFGWIDGLRRSIDEYSYKIRLTPRKPDSTWSAINTRLVKKLTEEGRMRPAGLKAFAARHEDRTAIYSFEQEKHKLGKKREARFKANKKAWEFYKSQPPWYQRVTAFYVVSAKKEETQERRLEILIRDSAAGRRIGLLNRKK